MRDNFGITQLLMFLEGRRTATTTGAWATGGNLATARANIAGTGIQTAALAIGGYKAAPGAGQVASTEEYDGSAWTAGGNLFLARNSLVAAGTQTAGLAWGGDAPIPTGFTNATEEYDGSTWTSGGNLSAARANPAAAGTQTAGLAFGGMTVPDRTMQLKNIMAQVGHQEEV
jgi:hypothetical protein